MLQSVVHAAKHARWSEMRQQLFSARDAPCALPNEMINSVPRDRRYGLLHQLAYHGAVDEYRWLVDQGVIFDGTMLTDTGQTAAEVATERSYDDFAAILGALPAVPRRGSVGIVGVTPLGCLRPIVRRNFLRWHIYRGCRGAVSVDLTVPGLRPAASMWPTAFLFRACVGTPSVNSGVRRWRRWSCSGGAMAWAFSDIRGASGALRAIPAVYLFGALGEEFAAFTVRHRVWAVHKHCLPSLKVSLHSQITGGV